MKHRSRHTISLRVLLLSFALAAGVATSGCFVVALGAAGAAGAGTVAYARGQLDATLANGYDQVLAASNRALDELQLVKISEKKDAFSAILIARTAEDKRVEIRIAKEGDILTTVRIRVGIFGDEEKSRTLLEKMRAGL
jgi:hypothetical protein